MAGGERAQKANVSDSGTGNGTEGAPADIAELLSNPETREAGLRAMASSTNRGYLAKDVFYKDGYAIDQYGEPELYTGAQVLGGKITFFKPAFKWNYAALQSILEHEMVHWHQYQVRGGAKSALEVARRELPAYIYQVESPTFRQTPIEFQRSVIRGFNIEIQNYRSLTETIRFVPCSDISSCGGK